PGRPDMHRASRAEQVAIEEACAPDKRMSGPAQYYQCLRRELARFGYTDDARPAGAAAAPGPQAARPAVQQAPAPGAPAPGAQPSARSASQAQATARSAAPAILAGANEFERASIERACAARRNSRDPSDYDSCLRRQMVD